MFKCELIFDFSYKKCLETRESQSGNRGEIVATATLSRETDEGWGGEFGGWQSESSHFAGGDDATSAVAQTARAFVQHSSDNISDNDNIVVEHAITAWGR